MTFNLDIKVPPRLIELPPQAFYENAYDKFVRSRIAYDAGIPATLPTTGRGQYFATNKPTNKKQALGGFFRRLADAIDGRITVAYHLDSFPVILDYEQKCQVIMKGADIARELFGSEIKGIMDEARTREFSPELFDDEKHTKSPSKPLSPRQQG